MSDRLQHLEATHSWWTGKAVTLCGLTFEPGEWSVVWFPGWGAPACEECARMYERGN